MSYADIIKKRIKDWNCDGLMEGARAKRGNKIPFSSPLLNYSTYGGIPRDAITEFFGAPGGGKSTIVNLIPRFYDVTTGSIEIDGIFS